MDALLLLSLLLVTSPFVADVQAEEEEDEEYRWPRGSLPVVLDRHTELLRASSFSGQLEDEDEGQNGIVGSVCGIECQSTMPPPDSSEQERLLGYETVYENGTRTETLVSLSGFNELNETSPGVSSSGRPRRKRQVYGTDGRFLISDSQFITNYPFSTAVRLSTGCSGVLVSPKHVLTAAHCVHDGSDYLDGVQRLKVGTLQLRSKRGRGGGRRRGGRRRGGRRGEGKGEEGTAEGEEEVEENGIEADMMRGRKGRRRGKRRGKEGGEEAADGGGGAGEGEGGAGAEGGAGERQRRRLKRRRRSAGAQKKPAFRWSRVKQTHIPKGWIHTNDVTNPLAPDYDYALLELKRPIKQQHMELGVAPSTTPLSRIHFSGYDTDKGSQDGGGAGGEKVVYRFCSVIKESDNLMYQHCDAQQGATGAGVYIRLKEEVSDTNRKEKWRRKVIGVFSGHRWVELEGGEQRDFNVAVRITPSKYAQICHWIHGDPSRCKEV